MARKFSRFISYRECRFFILSLSKIVCKIWLKEKNGIVIHLEEKSDKISLSLLNIETELYFGS